MRGSARRVCSHRRMTFTISSLPSGQSVLLYHHTKASSAWPSSLAHLKQSIRQRYRRSRHSDWRLTRLLLQTRSPAHQVSWVGFGNAASGFVLGRKNPACKPWRCSAMPDSTWGREGVNQEVYFRSALLIQIKTWKADIAIFQCLYPTPVPDLVSPPSINLFNLRKNRRKSFLSFFAFSLLTSGTFFPEMKG